LGIAVLGSIGTAVYRSEVAGAFPDGVPSGLAPAARDTLGGAVSVADRLPDPLTAGLLDAARAAFTQGLQLTAIISAAIVLGMAVLVLLLLRPACLSSDAEGPADTAPDRSSPGSTAEKL
jgi:DHA2 family multidrug resistance protein-like MFS transporter